MLSESMVNDILLAVLSLVFEGYNIFENAIDSLPRGEKKYIYAIPHILHKIFRLFLLRPSKILSWTYESTEVRSRPLAKGNRLIPLVQ